MFLISININSSSKQIEINDQISYVISSIKEKEGYLSHKVSGNINGSKFTVIEIYFKDSDAAILYQKNELLQWKESLERGFPAVNILINMSSVETMGSDGCSG